MKKKDLLIGLCENLEEEMNDRELHPFHKVRFESSLKPNGYYLPEIHLGTSKSMPVKELLSWFVEIWVDGTCIFRQSQIPHESDHLESIEAHLIDRVLRDVFTYGIMSSKKFIEDNGL